MVRLKLSVDLPDRSPAAAFHPAQTAMGAAAHSGAALAGVVSEAPPAIRPEASLAVEAFRVAASQVVTVVVFRAAMVEGDTVDNSI